MELITGATLLAIELFGIYRVTTRAKVPRSRKKKKTSADRKTKKSKF